VAASPEVADRSLALMKSKAEQAFRQADQALSDQIFWVYRGQWHHYPLTIIQGHPVAAPPPEFQRVFDSQPFEQAKNRPRAKSPAALPEIKFKCPRCLKVLSVPRSDSGKTAKCPACSTAIRIPTR
jgi:hypothetical protein